jgi:3-phosphoshikimate 1-carboxyvinyltransferase
VRIARTGELRGAAFDLNDTPDLLPACAVLGCFARGTTRLFNVAHARIKETDRIAVLAAELAKLGAQCRELPDGLEIRGTTLNGGLRPAVLNGHGDHRVVMALATAGLAITGGVTVTGAEAASVTYPGYLPLLR